MKFRIVLHITIFSKIIWFSEEITGNFFWGGGGIDISIFYVKIIDFSIETIDGFAKTIDSFRLSPNTTSLLANIFVTHFVIFFVTHLSELIPRNTDISVRNIKQKSISIYISISELVISILSISNQKFYLLSAIREISLFLQYKIYNILIFLCLVCELNNEMNNLLS